MKISKIPLPPPFPKGEKEESSTADSPKALLPLKKGGREGFMGKPLKNLKSYEKPFCFQGRRFPPISAGKPFGFDRIPKFCVHLRPNLILHLTQASRLCYKDDEFDFLPFSRRYVIQSGRETHEGITPLGIESSLDPHKISRKILPNEHSSEILDFGSVGRAPVTPGRAWSWTPKFN